MSEVPARDIGTWLRDTRERSGLSLRQIADTTKFSVFTFEALERNRIDQLPDGIYRRAIVRSYASQVGLDPEETLQTFLGAFPQDPSTFPHVVAPDAPPAPGRMVRALLSFVAAIVPVLAVVFYFTLIARGADAPSPRARRTVAADVAVAGGRADALPSPSGPISMVISISSRCRLNIAVDGVDVLARDVDAGELLRLSLASEVVLSGDDAGAVHFSINGRAGKSFGDARTPLDVRISRADYQRWLIRS